MNLFEHYKKLVEDTGTQYSSGTGYSAHTPHAGPERESSGAR